MLGSSDDLVHVVRKLSTALLGGAPVPEGCYWRSVADRGHEFPEGHVRLTSERRRGLVPQVVDPRALEPNLGQSCPAERQPLPPGLATPT
jgi:hypothetical protein